MKILAVMGSPRGKGKGFEIVKMIEERMKLKGEVDFEYLFLKDIVLKPCIGCYACLAMGENKCPHVDERSSIERKMLDADGIILSSPVYVLNVSSLMKNFIDRFAYTNHRPRFFSQKILTVANSGGSSSRSVLAILKNSLGGSRLVGELAISTPRWSQSESTVARKIRAVKRTADAYYEACLDKKLQRPSLVSYTIFLAQKKFFEASKQYLPADFEYFSGKAYFYDAKINPFVNVLAHMITMLIAQKIKEMGPANIANA